MTKVDCFKKFFLKILLQFTVVLSATGHSQKPSGELEPEFLAPLENLTVTQGRDVSFTCVANNLGEYRVAWIKSDSKAILAIHTHMVALNPRLSVTHNGHNTWKLHISHVHLNDSGSYMCQVNTDPMRSQSGYLSVVVPPDILNLPDTNSATQEEGITPEGGTVSLVCSTTGVPMPSVQWRREGGKDIVVRNEGRDKQVVKHVDGERLTLHNVQRTDMGAYLCIASNGVPPSVSKRFDVKVIFVPVVRVVNQLVAAPVDRHVLLQCVVEAFPKPLNGWYRHDGTKIYESSKYQMTEGLINTYTWQLNLTVKNLQFDDFHTYVCSSINGLGKSEARIRLQELRLPPTSTTTPTPYMYTTAKPRRKATQSHIKPATFDVPKIKETVVTNHVQENEIAGAALEVPVRAGIEKTRNTQMPAAVPSRRTPWINLYDPTGCGSVSQPCNYCLLLVLLPALVRLTGRPVS